jgi:Ice-binding-like
VSGVTSNNFTSPVTYVVTAADNSTATYAVTVTVAATTAKSITAFSLDNVAGTINEATKTIGVILPSDTSVAGLIATFTTTGSSVTVGGVAQVSDATSNNFTNPVAYVVTAADNSTATYTVTATVVPATSKAMTSFSLAGVTGTINEAAKTIGLVMPSGTAVSGLIATFTTTGSSVAINGVAQVSGATSNNFTNPVAYVVTAADNSTATYTVTVTVAADGPVPVALGTAGNYALFSNAGMSSTPDSAITGDVGVGPGVTSTAITTGFTLTQVGAYATAPQVTGKVYAFNYDSPTPSYIISSSSDMGLAYDDARGRLNPDFTNLGGANLAGLTLSPGLYKWSSSINLAVNTTLTLNGGPNDVWILQVAGGLTTGANTNVSLTGGAVPENVFWQLDTGLTIGATSSFSGVVLAGSAVTVGAGSTIRGRLLAKTAITLDSNTVTKPAH